MDPASGAWRTNRPMYFRLDSRHLMGNLLICQAENEATGRDQPVQQSYRVDMLGNATPLYIVCIYREFNSPRARRAATGCAVRLQWPVNVI